MQLAKLEPQGLEAQGTSADSVQAKNPKLERSAHEFEASLMAELLKPLQDDDGAGSGGALAGFASQSLARAISERGGFGIADRILHQLESAGAGAQKEPKGNPPQAPLKLSGSPPI
jgi:flagellar protein FlgJ